MILTIDPWPSLLEIDDLIAQAKGYDSMCLRPTWSTEVRAEAETLVNHDGYYEHHMVKIRWVQEQRKDR